MSASDAEIRFVVACGVSDIPEGKSQMFVIEGRMIGVFHVDGHFYALANECPHAGASLAHGDMDGCTVSCRIHHWRFCLRSGAYLDEDKPQFNVKTFRVRVVEEQIQIGLPCGSD